VSRDGAHYTTAATQAGLSAYLNYLSFPAMRGRFVRLTLSGTANANNAVCDLQVFGSQATNALTEWQAWQIEWFGRTNASNGGALEDWDGDGVMNWDEFIAGTSPTSPASLFHVNSADADGSTDRFVLRWDTASGRSYTVQRSVNIVAGIWSNVPEANYVNVAGNGGTLCYTNSPLNSEPTFYRVKVIKP
jgi:hypothetical protein